MKVSSLCNTFLAGFLSCQKLDVFTTVETIHVISTQGQTEPPTTRTVSSSVITSQVFLSSVGPKPSGFPAQPSVKPRYSRFPDHSPDDSRGSRFPDQWPDDSRGSRIPDQWPDDSRGSRFPDQWPDDSRGSRFPDQSPDEPRYSRFPDRNGNSWTQYLTQHLSTQAPAAATSKSSARSTSTSKSSTSTKISSRSGVTSSRAPSSFSTRTTSSSLSSTNRVAASTLSTTRSPTSSSRAQTSSSLSTSSSRSSSSSRVSSSSSATSLTGTPITATPPSTTLPGATLPGATLPGVTLPGTTLPGTTLPSATLPSATPPSATGPSLPDLPPPVDYASTGLYYHNMHRLNHSAPLIVWNAAQAAIAAEIASSCVFAHNMTVGGGGYGQNLAAYGATGNVAALSPSSMLAKSITDQWYYGEVNSFLPSYYGQPTPDMSNFEAWGHFTQVVWKGSLSVGCASQLCPAGTIFPAPYQSWYTVCNYVPPGNYLGQFDTNVSPPIGLPSISV